MLFYMMMKRNFISCWPRKEGATPSQLKQVQDNFYMKKFIFNSIVSILTLLSFQSSFADSGSSKEAYSTASGAVNIAMEVASKAIEGLTLEQIEKMEDFYKFKQEKHYVNLRARLAFCIGKEFLMQKNASDNMELINLSCEYQLKRAIYDRCVKNNELNCK